MILYYIALAAIKIVDNVISTEKTILTQKGMAIASSLLVILSQLIFYFVVAEVVADGSIVTILIVSVASGIGNYVAFGINKKFSKETVYVNIITANEKAKMKAFGDYVRTEGIKIVMFDAFNDDIGKTLTAIVFANTKEQSSKIDQYMDSHDGFFREIV